MRWNTHCVASLAVDKRLWEKHFILLGSLTKLTFLDSNYSDDKQQQAHVGISP